MPPKPAQAGFRVSGYQESNEAQHSASLPAASRLFYSRRLAGNHSPKQNQQARGTKDDDVQKGQHGGGFNGGEYHMEGWQIDKRVSIGHLITTAVVIVSVVMWMLRVEAQIAVVMVRQDAIEKSIDYRYSVISKQLDALDNRLASRMAPRL